MVSVSSMVCMGIAAVISLLLPIVTGIYFHKKEGISFRPIWVGALVFVVFTQVLEKAMHLAVIAAVPWFVGTMWFALYGALAAGLFEEVGRFLAYKTLLKKHRAYKDGLSYGLGHGGIEAVLLGLTGNLNYIIYSVMINSGASKQLLGKVPPAFAAQMQGTLHLLVTQPPAFFLLGAVERLCALIIQVGLSLLVLYGVNKGQIRYLLLAILLHACVDFPAAALQNYMLLIEAWVLICAAVSFVYIRKSKKATVFHNGLGA